MLPAVLASPRPGPWGYWDRIVGPGASGWENAGTITVAVLAGLLAPLLLKLLAGHGLPDVPGQAVAVRLDRPASRE